MLEKKIEHQAPLFSVELDKKKKLEVTLVFFSISAVDMLLLIHDCVSAITFLMETTCGWQ
jgi:hypothetical protein